MAGQDIAFVIDNTGSMGGEIAAVKSSATEIVDALLGDGNSRAAIVTFNDFNQPLNTDVLGNSETVLEFTSNKTDVLNAIDGLTVFGGGDLPEYTFEGLYRALSGAAGEWRPDADDRKLILFGDAIAKDPELADEVFALALDLGASVEINLLASGVRSYRFEAAGGLPVEIYTVTTSSFSDEAKAEYAKIASETGGRSFDLDDDEALVATLLEIIAIDGRSFNEITGTKGNDKPLPGTKADDLIKGLAGNDVIRGKKGDDLIKAGKGNDKAVGGGGNDQLDGQKGNDNLKGGGGDDIMNGGAGRDMMTGGKGADLMKGGKGVDTFKYNKVGDSTKDSFDLISKLTKQDKIDLTKIDADTTSAGNDAFTFVGKAKLSGKAGELNFKKGILRGDVDGDGKADLYIALEFDGGAGALDLML